MKSKLTVRIGSLFFAVIWISFFSLIFDDSNKLAVIFFDIGSPLGVYPFTIQNIMWLMFFLCLGELFYRHQVSKSDVIALKQKYLLEEQGLFYDQKAMTEVMTKVSNQNNRLATLIKSLFMRYQASKKSTEETHQMLNSQLELMLFRLDVDYNIIRYICWLIPTLGFIGTVIGIAWALNYAGGEGVSELPDFLSQLTLRLEVAFYTTLVALLMSAILVYLLHIFQGREENVIQHCGEYCLNNFINRLLTV